MTLQEIKGEILNLRIAVENLQEEAIKLWANTEDKTTENICDYFETELGYISYRLSELEDIQVDSEGHVDTDGLEIGLQEWWEDLGNDDKASLVRIPAPSRNDARGDEQFDFDEYCNKWWNTKTIQQKQEVYKEFADEHPWWEE